MKIIAVIPARYSSTRLAGKVLLKDTGKYLIQHTYEQASLAKLPDRVIIAADDEKIVAAAKSFGAECILTSVNHQSGTDRIAEVVQKIADNVQRTADRENLNAPRYTLHADDIIVNVQGDEPEIDPANIDKVAKLLVDNPDYPMATLVAPFEKAEDVANPNIVKVIVSSCVVSDEYREKNTQYAIYNSQYALYFSRSPIPYDRQSGGIGDLSLYLRHIGIYAYRRDFLLKITTLPQSPLEKTEKLEQLRAIESGFGILVAKVERTRDGIDTPEQYAEFVKRNKNKLATEGTENTE